MKKLTACRILYTLFLIIVSAVFVNQIRLGNWLQTDLQTLLPESHFSLLQQQAELRQNDQLNRQLVVLIGHNEAQQAFKLASQTAEKWQTSGLFSQIFYQTTPDLTKLRAEVSLLAFATLPHNIRTQLLEQPAEYFQQYAAQIVNPFQQQNLLSLEQDWLGFGRFVLSNATQQSKFSWNAENGMLYHQAEDGINWVIIQAELAQSSLIAPDTTLLALVSQSREQIVAKDGKLLVAGSALFAAHAKQQAEKECTLMSITGVSLTLLLLLVVFRSLRVLWLFLPIGLGMLSGIVATVLAFGQIHILTLVIGTSLIGVLIDFPLHWLSGARFHSNWQPQVAMDKLRFTFVISLFVTLLGYLLLGFTPLKVLQQTALFSAVALITALLATMWFLPYLFKSYRISSLPSKSLLLRVGKLGRMNKLGRAFIRMLLASVALFGIIQTQWKDDIRQWVALPDSLLTQAQQISEITGIEQSGRYFLVVAEDNETLLNKEQSLIAQLLLLQQQGKIGSFNSLSQWIMSQSVQQALASQLSQKINLKDYAILTEIGLEPTAISQEIAGLSERIPVSLQTALNTEIGRAWQYFYLGELESGKVASIISIQGLQNLAEIAPLANGIDIFWQDKRTQLNNAFEQSRNQAAWLKLLSFALAGLLLWRLFGVRNAMKMLLVPFGAILATLAIFGWFNLPISLFAMFGLLLVSALGVDYTAYMQTVTEPVATKQRAILLAATSTLISFLLLSLSSTPAVSAFGLSVSLGVMFSVLLTFKLFK